MVAVNMPSTPMPKHISTTPISRPPSDTGEMSPKPTVVTVTMDHQTASWKGRSSSKYAKPAAPARTRTAIRPMSRKRCSRRRNASSAATDCRARDPGLLIVRRQAAAAIPGPPRAYSVNPMSIDAAR